MDFVFRRGYRGNLKCAILDWAGTTMDYGVYAPAVVFVEVFKRQGLAISMEEAKKQNLKFLFWTVRIPSLD